MSDGVKPRPQQPRKRVEDAGDDTSSKILQELMKQNANSRGISKAWLIGFGVIVVLFIATIVAGSITFVRTTNRMHETYIRNVEDVITSRAEIQAANDWERLPEEQRKSMLREQFNTIIRYYNNTVPEEQRMSDEQIIDAFNELWRTTEKIPSINFFLPVAYMRVATNFNPIYDSASKKGIAAFYLRAIEDTINLPLVQNDPVFRAVYRGSDTAFDPVEMMKILVARIDNLMNTFRNREDWVILALFTNEYDVIARYWNDGEGAIPDEFYQQGEVAETLKYYYAFKNWQIPLIEDE
jgi:hypothetical protein